MTTYFHPENDLATTEYLGVEDIAKLNFVPMSDYFAVILTRAKQEFAP
jgi:hypothetical protein